MDTLRDMLVTTGSFLAALGLRLGLFLAIPIAMALAAAAWLGIRALWRVAARRAAGHERVEGLWWRPGVAYTRGHLWLRARGRRIRVGLDDLGVRLMPPGARLTLPERGRDLRAGTPALGWESGVFRTALVSPVTGRVVSVNGGLASDTRPLRRDPYLGGWLFEVETSEAPAGTLGGDAARTWFAQESSKLARFTESELGLAAADGGELLAPLPTLIRPDQWAKLAAEFLRPQ